MIHKPGRAETVRQQILNELLLCARDPGYSQTNREMPQLDRKPHRLTLQLFHQRPPAPNPWSISLDRPILSPLLPEAPLLLRTRLLASTPTPVQIPKGSQASEDNEEDARGQSHSQACYVHLSTPCGGRGSHGLRGCHPPQHPKAFPQGEEDWTGNKAELGPLPSCVTSGNSPHSFLGLHFLLCKMGPITPP